MPPVLSCGRLAHDDYRDDEHPHAETSSKRRAAALLVFSDHALRRLRVTALATSQQERASSKTLLALLLAVSTSHAGDVSYAEVTAAARSAMNSTLGIMSAPDFVEGILTILQSSSPSVRVVLHLLSGQHLC